MQQTTYTWQEDVQSVVHYSSRSVLLVLLLAVVTDTAGLSTYMALVWLEHCVTFLSFNMDVHVALAYVSLQLL